MKLAIRPLYALNPAQGRIVVETADPATLGEFVLRGLDQSPTGEVSVRHEDGESVSRREGALKPMAGEAQTEIRRGTPLRDEWEKYQQTESFANTKKWAAFPEHLQGSLWAVFVAGWQAAHTGTEPRGE